MLDEELEIEQKAIKKDDLTSNGRYIVDSSFCNFYFFFPCIVTVGIIFKRIEWNKKRFCLHKEVWE